MKIDYGIWDKFGDHTIDEVQRWIDPNNTTFEQTKYIYEAVGGLKEKKNVLDFGCGMGRNMIGLARLADNWTLTGYDNPSMVERASSKLMILPGKDLARTRLMSDWTEVVLLTKSSLFDVIFCVITLQHIPEAQLRWYLEMFKDMGKELFVQGRRALDASNYSGYDGGKEFNSVWDVIIDCGYEIKESQKGFSMTGNGNDHHWVKFIEKGRKETKHVREERKHDGTEQRHGRPFDIAGV
jgi:SAM-dependent methyltransferase